MRMKRFIYSLLLLAISMTSALRAMPAHAEQSIQAGDSQTIRVGVDEFEAGVVIIPGIPISWDSAQPCRLTVNAIDSDLGASDDGTRIKPLEDVSWSISKGGRTWHPLTEDPIEIEWSSLNESTGVIYIDLAVKLNWLDDPPGEYHINLIFSIEPA
jgi:hypothetical protein